MDKIQTSCAFCGDPVFKPRNEYNRQVRAGRTEFFCNLSCAASHGNQTIDGKLRGLLRGNPRPQLDPLSPFRWYIIRARYRSEKGPTNLTAEYLQALFFSQGGICPLTGWKMVLPRDTSGFIADTRENASLDRIDNSLGYVVGNVRFVAVMANLARGEYSDSELRSFCASVVLYKPSDKPAGIAGIFMEDILQEEAQKILNPQHMLGKADVYRKL